MASFHAVRLPSVIEQGAEGGPMFSTSIATTLGGHEQRVGNWRLPRAKWRVSSGPRDSDAFDELLAFFMARQGRLYGWLFRDWSDYVAPAGSPLYTDPTTGTKYLAKAYTSGGVTLLRPITRPVAGTYTLTSGAASSTTGVVTGAADGATWGGQFDLPVRFDNDEYKLTLDQIDIGTVNLDIIELRE